MRLVRGDADLAGEPRRARRPRPSPRRCARWRARMPRGLRPPPALRRRAARTGPAPRAARFAGAGRAGCRGRITGVPAAARRCAGTAAGSRWWAAAGAGPRARLLQRCAPRLRGGAYGAPAARARTTAAAAVAAAAGGALPRPRRRAAAAPARRSPCSAPAAAAVLLHEAVAHALEADTLAPSGNPRGGGRPRRRRRGARRARRSRRRHPPGVRRATDDEGLPVLRRWLLRGGVVEQPLADALWARALAGAACRAPAARQRATAAGAALASTSSSCPATDALADLAGRRPSDGLLRREATRGCLDPLSGAFELALPVRPANPRAARSGEPSARSACAARSRDLSARVDSAGRRGRPWPAPAGAPRGARGCRSGRTAPALLLARRGRGRAR